MLPSTDVDDDGTQPKDRCFRGVEVDLYAVVKAQAKAEGISVRDWLERAVIHELAQARKQLLPLAADLGNKHMKDSYSD